MARRRGEVDGSKKKFWQEAVARQAASRLSISEWCRRESIREPAFYWWRRRLAAMPGGSSRGMNVEPGATAADFLPIRVAPSAIIEIVLTDGVRLQVTPGVTTDQLRQVLCALRAALC